VASVVSAQETVEGVEDAQTTVSPAPDAVLSGVAAMEGDVIIGNVPTEIDADVLETAALVPDEIVETSAGVGDVEKAATRGPDESDMVSIAGTVMSIGDSSSEGSPCPRTYRSSASATVSRKRAANESPERELVGNTRRDFPGRVAPRAVVFMCHRCGTIKQNARGEY